MKHVNLRIFGKVQGVFFRASALEEAERLGVSGFAKNETGGSVYIEAEGPEDVLDQFAQWCGRGPSHAGVETIEKTDGPMKGFIGFKVTFS